MNVFDAVSRRRAVRRFSGTPVPRGQIDRVLEAGRRAPSSMNEQRWDFILCTDRETLRKLAQVGDWTAHLAGAAFAVALVVPEAGQDWERESIAFDLGQVAENMMLVAWEHGIGSVHGSVYDDELARELLGYPPDRRCDMILSFGIPADPSMLSRAPSTGRRPLDEIVHEEHW